MQRLIVVALTMHVGYTKIMAVIFSDTHEKIEQLQIEIIRNIPSWICSSTPFKRPRQGISLAVIV
jgi:hypothetical protein